MYNDIRSGLLTLLPRLRRFAMSLTGSAVEADELVQDACERVLRRNDQIRDQTRLDAWMYGILRNLWADELRSRRVRRHESVDTMPDMAGDDGRITTEGSLALADVRRALAALPVEQRAPIMLVCVDGLSYQEAANILNIPIGTVMSRLSRGRQGLKDFFDERPAVTNVTPLVPREARLACVAG